MNQGLNETERYAMDELNRLRQWYETASKPYFDMLVRERRMRMPDRFLFVPDDDTRPFQGMNLDQMWIDESEQVTLPAPRVSNNPGETSNAWMQGYEAALEWRKQMDRWLFGASETPPPNPPVNPYKAGQE
jgi:hypothetical protein